MIVRDAILRIRACMTTQTYAAGGFELGTQCMNPTSRMNAELGEPYAPTSVALPPGLKSLAWRKRTIRVFQRPEEQFLVLAPEEIYQRYGHRVLGSGPNEAHAAASAVLGLAYHAQQPTDFCPELVGYSFKVSASRSSAIAVWNCVDPEGKVVGQADGKREAAKDARFALLSARPVSELTPDEFALLATPVRVLPGFGRRDKATLLDDEPTEFRRFIGRMYRHAPELAREGELLDDFVQRIRSGLQDFRLGDNPVLYLPIRDASGASPLTFHLVFHTAAVSAAEAVALSYEAEQAALLRQIEKAVETDEAAAPRG